MSSAPVTTEFSEGFRTTRKAAIYFCISFIAMVFFAGAPLGVELPGTKIPLAIPKNIAILMLAVGSLYFLYSMGAQLIDEHPILSVANEKEHADLMSTLNDKAAHAHSLFSQSKDLVEFAALNGPSLAETSRVLALRLDELGVLIERINKTPIEANFRGAISAADLPLALAIITQTRNALQRADLLFNYMPRLGPEYLSTRIEMGEKALHDMTRELKRFDGSISRRMRRVRGLRGSRVLMEGWVIFVLLVATYFSGIVYYWAS